MGGSWIAGLSVGLFIAASSPAIAANFGPITKWTIVSNILTTIGLEQVVIEVLGSSKNSGKRLGKPVKEALQHSAEFVLPCATTLLGFVGLVVAIWSRCEVSEAKTSDEFDLVGGIFSSTGGLLTAFTSNKLYPLIGALVYAVSAGCTIADGHFTGSSGVCVLNGS